MIKHFQKLFISPNNKNKLHYNGTHIGEKWQNGFLQLSNDEKKYKVINGIPCFVEPKDDPWSDYDKLEEQLGESPEGVVEKNWLGMIKNESLIINMVRKVVSISTAQNGLILEIGCGPGGGLTPLVLNKNSNSKILLNDYGFWILSETNNFIQKTNKWKNVSMAQFDATQIPLCDNSFDIIQSFGGFSNMKNSHQVLEECYRVLKPNGQLCFIDAIINKNQFEKLPEDIVQKWYSDMPFLKFGLKKILLSHHFKNIQIEVVGKRQMRKDEGTLATIANNYKTELDIEFNSIIAEK